MLPNFNERWWDGIILDILICNLSSSVCRIMQFKSNQPVCCLCDFYGFFASDPINYIQELERK